MEKTFNLTHEELINISNLIEDCTSCSTEGRTGGMYIDGTYVTPGTCFMLKGVLKKINEYLYENPTIYKEAYRKLKEYSKSK